MTTVRMRSGISAIGGLLLVVIIAVALIWALNSRADRGSPVPLDAPAAAQHQVVNQAAAVPAALAVVRSSDPASDIGVRIMKATGATCFVRSHGNRLITDGSDYDKRISALGGTGDRWLEQDRSWIGSSSGSALAAFGANWAGQKEGASAIWAQVTRDGSDVGIELIPHQTPAGATVWTTGDSIATSKVCTD